MKPVITVLCCVLFAPAAMAATNANTTAQDNNFSWTYLDGIVSTHNYRHVDDNATGIEGGLSYAIDKHIYALGGIEYQRVHRFHFWQARGGLGFHTPLKTDLDIFADGQLTHNRSRIINSHRNGTGYLLRAGLRARATNTVELKGGVYHQDIKHVTGSDTGVFGSALYHVNQQVDVGARLSLGDEQRSAFGLFGRYNF